MAEARTLMIMAGGTGGHVYPALAVAEELRGRGWQVCWLGTRSGLEARVGPEHGFDMIWLAMGGVRGKGLGRMLLLPVVLLRAFWQSLRAILICRPDVVLGMGGYTAFPGGMMARLMQRPLVIHEQNSIAGLTNRLLACFAERVLTAFPGAFQGRDKPIFCRGVNGFWVGNPVRGAIADAAGPDRYAGREGPLRLLVVGGSLGAAALNELVPRALALMPAERRPQVIHQSGAKHLESLKAHYAEAGVAAELKEYIADMAWHYDWCDVAITRAGAMTVAELAIAGVPAVLVPFPYAVDDHQTANARFLEQAGGAWLMPQEELTAEKLAAHLSGLARTELVAMAQSAKTCAKPQATSSVADVCQELA